MGGEFLSISRRRLARAVTGFACAIGIMTTATPASAEVRLGREADGAFRVSVMSWWEIPFRSIVRQQYDFSCGSAAVATLLTHHYGRPTTERDVFLHMWRIGDRSRIRQVGFSMLEMREYLRSLGYRAEGLRLSLDELRQVRRPTVVLLDDDGFKHFVVVKGVRGDMILLGDSIRGLTQHPISEFARMWNGIVLAILDTPPEGRPRFNLVAEWSPWSEAPLDDGGDGIRLAAGDLTTHLPNSYQIAPQLLLDVRVGTVR